MSIQVPPPPFRTSVSDASGRMTTEWQRHVLASQTTLTTDVAPADARYVVVTANPSLTAESNLALLSAGHLSITVAGALAAIQSSATIPASDLTGPLGALDGSALTNLNASALASGTVNGARLPDPLPALNGSALTALTAANLTGALPAISGAALTALPNPLPATSGVNLTSLNASALASGTVPQARLPFVLDADVYTPTLTNVANLDGSTAYSCQYLRVGSVVTVSGQVDLDPTTTLTDTQLGISLPIASNFANANECAGSGSAPAIAAMTVAILGDVANNRATLQFKATDVTSQPVFFSFTYRII